MAADVIQLDEHRPQVLVDAVEYARLRDVERLATLLLTEIYNRRAKHWFRAPMAFVEPLRAALLRGRT
jgi:hypothetical protein